MMFKIRMTMTPLLFLVLGMASHSHARLSADAERTDVIPSIKITNAQTFKGQYIHVIYAIGRHGFLNASPVPYLFEIRTTHTQQVTGPEVQFPPVQLDKKPFRGSYNIIVLTLSDTPNVTWANPDASVRTDYSILQIIDKTTMDFFVNQAGPEAIYTIEL